MDALAKVRLFFSCDILVRKNVRPSCSPPMAKQHLLSYPQSRLVILLFSLSLSFSYLFFTPSSFFYSHKFLYVPCLFPNFLAFPPIEAKEAHANSERTFMPLTLRPFKLKAAFVLAEILLALFRCLMSLCLNIMYQD